MKKTGIVIAFLLITATGFCQNNAEAEGLVREGIGLHDKGLYDDAVKKYDEAIKLDKNFFDAYYEKSYSLYAAGKHKECLDLCKDAVKQFSDHPSIGLLYIQYGNVLDDLGKPKKALEIYDEGIVKHPDNYLLYFNKGLTLTKMEETADALVHYQKSLRLKPLHSSSNYYTGTLLEKGNRIPALLSYLTFLCIEPQTKRSADAYTRVNHILNGNVKREGNNTTIFLDPSSLNKKKNEENDFSTVEMILTLSSALDNDKSIDSIAKTAADKLSVRIQLLINSLEESQKDQKGFYWKHYVPFFVAMKEAGQVGTLAHLVLLPAKDEENNEWIKSNEAEIEKFYDWLKNYKWKTP